MSELRESGIDVLGEIPWGSHFCQFYETKKDLLDLLIPYFKTGLENNEFCLWITSNPLTQENVIYELKKAIPGFDNFFLRQSIEILAHNEWYLKKGKFNPKAIITGWNEKLKRALKKGYEGMRVNGNESWLEQEDWDNFMEYERELNRTLHGKRMIVLCTYPLSKTTAASILDVAHSHERAISKRRGHWEILEEPEIKKIKAQLKQRADELEQQVANRTTELTITIEQLQKEIADRKQAEEALRKSEDNLRLVIDTIPALVWCAQPDGSVDFINQTHREFTGLSLDDVGGWRWISVIHPEDREDTLAKWRRALATGEPIKTEARLRRAYGDYRWLLVQAVPLLDKSGNILQWYGTKTDITELKQAEDALRQSEDRIRLIIDTIPIMAWSTRPDGTVDFVNQRWMDYSGLSLEEESKEPTVVIHPEDTPGVMKTWLMNKATGTAFEDEMRLRAANGEYRWFLVRTAPLHDEHGNIVKWYGISIDIEDRKRVEDELKLAYQRLSYHVENTPLAVIELDKELFIKRWSKRAEEIFGWKASEALGKNVYDPDFPIIYIEDIPAVDKINEQLTKGVVNRNLSLNRNYSKDGKVIHSEWYNSVLRDEQGNVITILSLVHNITERKKAEETLQQSYEEIKRLTRHLQKIREEERTSIAREIHDEMGQQLTVLKMEVKGLNKKLKDANGGIKQKITDILDLLDTTVKSVRRISSELRPSLLYNLGLIAAIEWHLKEFEKRSGIKTIFNEPKEELQLSDSLKNGLFRIFQESLTNVSRHANASKVKVTLKQKGRQLILSIEDNGQGFEKENIAAKDTLGILGMKERSQMMGGNYEISSTFGKGTTVIVSVPYNGK